MTQEEMERTMQFILQQQAQFAANMQQLAERQRETGERMTKIENVVLRLANAQVEANERHKETEERLNALINTVERYISKRRNGKTHDSE